MVLPTCLKLERDPGLDATLRVLEHGSCRVYTFPFFCLLFELGHIINVSLDEILISPRFRGERSQLGGKLRFKHGAG